MSPRFFIDRPIFASVLSIVIVVIGLVAMRDPPIAQFPRSRLLSSRSMPTIPVPALKSWPIRLPAPIELQLPGIDNLLYYDSTSTNDGHVTIKLTFEIGTNVDIAQVQTQNREKLAEPQLPPDVIRQGVTVKKLSPDLLGVLDLAIRPIPGTTRCFSPTMRSVRLVDNVKRIPGVGDALIFGQQNYSMR